MILQKKIFTGGINTDDSLNNLGADEALNMENMRVVVSGTNRATYLTGIPSTSIVFDGLPDGDNECIGTTVDYSTLRLIWANYNSEGEHGFYAYDLLANTTYIILLDSQTEEGLNFSLSDRVFREMEANNGLLFWTNNVNEPGCLSIEAGIKLNQPSYDTEVEPYETPIPYTTITLIKRPPIYRLQCTKFFDSGFNNNFIQNKSYQFRYRYWYKNYQYSVLSTFSQLMPYNANDESSNAIYVKLVFGEDIDDYVQQIDIVVTYGNTGKSFIIKSWNKDNFYDLMAIESHNANLVQLGITFYDNITGIAIDDITANTSFDSVALAAKTLQLARNRLFLGNVLKGYDTPFETSLTTSVTSVDTGSGGPFSGDWGYVTLNANFVACVGVQDDYMYPFVSLSGATYLYYYIPSARVGTIWNGGVGSVPSTINLNDATFGGNTEADLITFLKSTQYPFSGSCAIGSPTWQVPYSISYGTLGGVTAYTFAPVSTNQFFKSSSLYRVTIAFYDRFRRKCGVVNISTNVEIPERTYTQTEFSAAIAWALSNDDALNEIPDWAYYYQIHITKNLTTRFFVQAQAADMTYVLRDDTTGEYDYGNATSSLTDYAIGINIKALTGFGAGYTFNEGDYAILYLSDDTNRTLAIIGQDGNWVLVSPIDIGTLDNTTELLYELYTPYRASSTEPYFETGDMLLISNPSTANRAYTTLSGTINGDVYAVERDLVVGSGTYLTEAMSPNDNTWQLWQVDRGWANFIDTIGQQLKETNIDWSETYINGTKTNGLNVFDPLNTKNIGSSSGSIQKLQLTNKMQEAGDVMLVVCQNQTLSAYLQEVQLYQAAQTSDIITTDDVIGTINPLKFTTGTINPESVIEYNGMVCGIDIVRGLVWQYDANGITPISYFKARRFWDKYGKRYVEQGTDTIESLCGFSFMTGCYDPSTGEAMWVMPQTEENNVISGIPVGYAPELPSYSTLPSYATSIQNRFDFYDGQPKIVVYNYEQNKWKGAYQWLPEALEFVGNKLFGFKNGVLWLQNEGETYNNIYGTEYPGRICWVDNTISPSAIKDEMGIGVEGNIIPSYSVLYVDYPNEQITDLSDTDTNLDGTTVWQNKEGVQYAPFFRDRLSPNTTGTPDEKMRKGDVIKSATPMVMLEFTEYEQQLIINFVNLGFEISKAQQYLLTKQ